MFDTKESRPSGILRFMTIEPASVHREEQQSNDTLIYKCCSGLLLTFTEDEPSIPIMAPRRRFHLAAKRLIDIGLGGGALVFLLPLMLLVAIAVRLSTRGSVLFRQMRPGLNGEMFSIYKFRTMHASQGDDSGIQQTTINDPRVTRLGALLRRTNIDELPQLFNVVLGQMSLVGPRPHALGMRAAGRDYRDLVPYYDMRQMMPPGLSGWAQANSYRGPTIEAKTAIERIEHDIAYVQNFSIWLDLRVILLTLRRELFGGSGF